MESCGIRSMEKCIVQKKIKLTGNLKPRKEKTLCLACITQIARICWKRVFLKRDQDASN